MQNIRIFSSDEETTLPRPPSPPHNSLSRPSEPEQPPKGDASHPKSTTKQPVTPKTPRIDIVPQTFPRQRRNGLFTSGCRESSSPRPTTSFQHSFTSKSNPKPSETAKKKMMSRGSRFAAASRARESELSARDIKAVLGFGHYNNHGYLVLREFIKSHSIGHGVTGAHQPTLKAWLGCVGVTRGCEFLSRFRMAYCGVGPKEHCKLV
ncbi:hypothetical protein Q9L58_010423 [Maublancomyces gigas]|uniref:Uncharacterized protein n=1 Tax=Discina gigas TaxID=1032678 RepID=A0ABR3G4I9_9PEZI